MTAFAEAAKALLSRRAAGTKAPRLEESQRPQNIEDALAIQAEMMQLQAVKGWKCLLPIAEDKLIVAPVFNVQTGGSELELFEDEGKARVEPEIGFVLAKALPAQQEDYSEEEIIAAIGSAHMALEMVKSRYTDDAGQSFFETLADCLINQGIYLGPEIDVNTAVNISKVDITISDSAERKLDGVHPNPRAIDGLVWLVNFMSKRGVSFAAGEAIITGSFNGIVDMSFDVATTINYEGLGEYTVTFKRAV